MVLTSLWLMLKRIFVLACQLLIKLCTKKGFVIITLVSLIALIALSACTSTARNHRMEIQVRCPPETGGSKFLIPEILNAEFRQNYEL